jgi:hypothetical protein
MPTAQGTTKKATLRDFKAVADTFETDEEGPWLA